MNLALKLVFYLFGLIILLLAALWINYTLISYSASANIEEEVSKLTNFHHVLIPGAGNSPLGEWQNTSFSNRLNSCVTLYSKIKITRIVCSGKILPPFYHEATDMRDFLVKKGIPTTVIQLDQSSPATRQSIANYAAKYKADSVIIISQKLHLERALFAAKFYGLQAKGYSAGSYKKQAYPHVFYEALARFKLSMELLMEFVFGLER